VTPPPAAPSQAPPVPVFNAPPPEPKVAPPPPAPATKPPAPPPQANSAQPMTEVVQSGASSIPCPQCGQPATLGSAFCGSCGATLTVPKTIVMSSPHAPLKAKLHLVMEGGQLGEVYDLTDETVIGRTNGDICFPHDGFMSGRHARITRRGTTFVLLDEG